MKEHRNSKKQTKVLLSYIIKFCDIESEPQKSYGKNPCQGRNIFLTFLLIDPLGRLKARRGEGGFRLAVRRGGFLVTVRCLHLTAIIK